MIQIATQPYDLLIVRFIVIDGNVMAEKSDSPQSAATQQFFVKGNPDLFELLGPKHRTLFGGINVLSHLW